MATRTKGFRASWPQWSLLLFVALLVLTYVLVFFTGNREATPKLGIDLQGGTRVTLVPQGEQPTQDQLDQARRILENRVNGMGVTGAQVVTDGDTLVITVPGEDSQEARALGQTSQLFFRPVSQMGMPDVEALTDTSVEMANEWCPSAYHPRAGQRTPRAAERVAAATRDVHRDVRAAEPRPAVAGELQMEVGEAGDRHRHAAGGASTPWRPPSSEEVRDVLLSRQSEDPTTLFAAQGLMCCEDPGARPAGRRRRPVAAAHHLRPEHPGRHADARPGPAARRRDRRGERQAPVGRRHRHNSAITGYDQNTGDVQVSFSFKSGSNDAGGRTWTQLTTDTAAADRHRPGPQVISAPVIQDPTPAARRPASPATSPSTRRRRWRTTSATARCPCPSRARTASRAAPPRPSRRPWAPRR